MGSFFWVHPFLSGDSTLFITHSFRTLIGVPQL
jgi:hypothetical protein